MIRFFFVLLAVVVVVLAFVMEWPWFVTGVALLVALGVAGVSIWQSRRKAKQSFSSDKPLSREEELNALGIVEIREKRDRQESKARPVTPERSPAVDEPAEEEETAKPSQQQGAEADSAEEKEQRGVPRHTTARAAALSDPGPSAAEEDEREEVEEAEEEDPAQEQRSVASEEQHEEESHEEQRAVLRPYLQALRAALDAHTVCLLAQEEIALKYRVEAAVGPAAYLEEGSTFSTQAPLLTAGMSHQDATLKPVGPDGIELERLRYYDGAVPAIQHVVLAPVSRPGKPTTWFLLADAVGEGFARERATRVLMARFADLLALILDVRADGDEESYVEVREDDRREPVHARENGAQEDAQAPRPRREIITEEMERAQAEGHRLALALVYLNRAEVIAGRGPQAIETAEKALRARLEEATPEGRVEPFGELTYGVFYNGDVDEVEAWAVRLESELAQAKPPLEGGVSIGLAMLQERHEHPDALRADATEALREAYKTGTCTILE